MFRFQGYLEGIQIKNTSLQKKPFRKISSITEPILQNFRSEFYLNFKISRNKSREKHKILKSTLLFSSGIAHKKLLQILHAYIFGESKLQNTRKMSTKYM